MFSIADFRFLIGAASARAALAFRGNRKSKIKNQKSRVSAFTLTELLVVIGIIVFVSAVSIPTIMPFFKRQALSSGARVTQAMLIHARSAAISERRPAAVILQAEDAANGQWSAGTLLVCYDSNDDNVITRNPEDILGTPASLPQGITFNLRGDASGNQYLLYDPSNPVGNVNEKQGVRADGAITVTYMPDGLVKPGDYPPNIGLAVGIRDASAGDATTVTVPGYMGR